MRTGPEGSFRFRDLPSGSHRVHKPDKKLSGVRAPAKRRLLDVDAQDVEMVVDR